MKSIDFFERFSERFDEHEFLSLRKEKEKDFSINCNSVTACSRKPKGEIRFTSETWFSLIQLCSEIDSEWMGYLTGTIEPPLALVEGIYFPLQNAAGAEVSPIGKPEILPGTIGCIHSHVAMNAKFSSTDRDHANWPIEIVINVKGEYEASMRTQLPCGEFMRVESEVLLETSEVHKRWKGEVKEAIAVGDRIRKEEEQKRALEMETLRSVSIQSSSQWEGVKGKQRKKKSTKPKCKAVGCYNEGEGKSGLCDKCWEEMLSPQKGI